MRNLLSALFLLIYITANTQDPNSYAIPEVIITRDDHVATIAMDYNANAGFGGQLWDFGKDGTDPSGYLIRWWPHPDDTSQIITGRGCYSDAHSGAMKMGSVDDPFEFVSINPIAQIQPLANNVRYYIQVSKINGFGQICSPTFETVFMGGDPTRVDDLRNTMTFFDDFNLPMGPPDELKWNNAMTPQTDPRFNLFFVNGQCHTHTLTGTLSFAAGDKAQVAQRARKPVLIEEGERRKIVFDMDGLFNPRGVWYLDLNSVKTDLTGHMSFFDLDGDTGLPADVLRLKAQGHKIFVHLINSAGALYNVASVDLSDFGMRMSTNVRRAFDVSLGTDGIDVKVDGVEVLSADFNPGSFKPGVYDLLWSTIGYNTSKDDNPYFLSHWDNFGFDGPDVEPYVVHNYVTRIIGTDLQKVNNNAGLNPTFNIQVPDDVRPVVDGITNDVYLVFTYMKNDYTFFNIEEGDHFMFNGVSYPLPQGGNNTSPEVPGLVDYSGSTISNRIKIGEATKDDPSPILVGNNTIQFYASNTGIVNVHLEVICPQDQPLPDYTPPSEIHPFLLHHDLPKLGTPARIFGVDGTIITEEDEEVMVGPNVTGIVPIEVMIGNQPWANWGPHFFQMPAYSAEMWSIGSTKGFDEVGLYIKPAGVDTIPPILIDRLVTHNEVSAVQLRYEFDFDSKGFVNGDYELFVQAVNSKGLKSHPSYDGFGFMFDAEEVAGAYRPVLISITNDPINGDFTFIGSMDSDWKENGNWRSGYMPPFGYDGEIIIEADCEVPDNYHLFLSSDATIRIKDGVEFRVKSK